MESKVTKERGSYDAKVSRVFSNPSSPPEGLGDGEETEITAQISLPQDGGWGWVVVASSFVSIAILDSICFTFGALIDDMSKDLNKPMSLIGLINSVQVGMYFLFSPIAAALINKLGFRACIMGSSVVIYLSLLISYFTKGFEFICFFYGVCIGFGAAVLNMSASLSVGFYFEKLRTIALSIVGTGSSCGIMAMFPVNAYLTKTAGWRSTTLFQSGLAGIVYFLGLTYRPLLSFTVTLEDENAKDPTRTVTILPSLAKVSTTAKGGIRSTPTERVLGAVSNAHFPTAAAVVSTPAVVRAGSSTASDAGVSKLTLRANTPAGTVSRQQLKQVQSIISKYNVQDKKYSIDYTNIKVEQPKKIGCCARFFHWEPHIQQARPMYRDDAFYEGRLMNLPEYQKSVLNADARSRNGLEYQLAVTRAVTVNDLQEKRGVFTTAVRRVLASMLDPTLFKKRSFLLFCLSGWLCHLGYLLPLIFLKDKNEKAGMDPTHCNLAVSTIGFTNGFGRIVIGFLAGKVDPTIMFIVCIVINGASTICCPLMHGVFLQYLYAVVFGFTAGGFFGLRSIVVVKIYGLEKLTNAMGIILMFLGIGNILSTPTGGLLEAKFGYDASFYYSGICVLLSGVILFPIKRIVALENKEVNSTINKVQEPQNQSFTPPPLTATPPSPPPPPLSPPPLPAMLPMISTTPQPSSSPQQQQQRSNYRTLRENIQKYN